MNGTSLKKLQPEIKSDFNEEYYITFSTLNVTSKAVYNGTIVQCVTGDNEGLLVESENATLTIQGTHFH